MKLMADANWWMPEWTRIVLRLPAPEPVLAVAVKSALLTSVNPGSFVESLATGVQCVRFQSMGDR